MIVTNVYCCFLLFILVNYTESLRCRSGNQQSNDQLHKIMQNCRKKYSNGDNKTGKDYSVSNENDSSEEDSASSSSFEEELFFGSGNKKNNGNNARNGGNYGQSSSNNYGGNRRNDRQKQDSNTYRSYSSNPMNYTATNERSNSMSNTNEHWNYRNGVQSSQNRDNNNEDRRDRTECVSQCFFDELNLVDQRGFPDRGSVMEMMTRGVQDPGVRDFIEESISECFHYLDSDTNNREKCTFSKNLLSCFSDKGKERCEDWDDK